MAATVLSRHPRMLHLLSVLLGSGRICGHTVSVLCPAADGDTSHICFASAEMLSPANRDVTSRDRWCHQLWVQRGQADQVSRGPLVPLLPADTAQPQSNRTAPHHKSGTHLWSDVDSWLLTSPTAEVSMVTICCQTCQVFRTLLGHRRTFLQH